MKNHDASASRGILRAFFAPTVVAALATFVAPASALTDLTSTPLQGSTAAQVKPNIMLLMDASNSMGWGHMPDEVETITGYASVGYKNSQCNVLYYNPLQRYAVPKKADGTFFSTPSFTAAPYAGFVSYYSAADQTDAPDGLNSSIVNLSTLFKAYDRKMLFQTFHNDTAQPAYYYAYTGAQTLTYAGAPCTDSDTGATRAATGGGNWNKIIVNSTSGPGATDERTNFAIWYSFYRTRISLIKSAASLAFTPLTSSFRVGFITVEPKDSPTASSINTNRYVPLADFDTTQRGIWFGKLFSQAPFGASPAREGLARVGRYYANKHDGINTGMDGDPMQYSCQQNFTIMTTDGYWNAQTETPTNVTTKGGPLMLDGVTKVGEQDGDPTCPVTDPYCPRPIYDGAPGSNHVDTDVSTLYADQSCGLSVTLGSTFQTTATYSQMLKTTTSTTQRTQYYSLTSAQDMAQTSQMTATVKQQSMTTVQFATATTNYVEDRYQVKKSQDQTTSYQEQWKQQKIQFNVQTSYVTKVQTQTTESSSQAQQITKQYVSTTTQFAQYVQQYTQNTVQTIKHVYQTLSYDSSQERQDAISGTCVTGGTITCSTNEMFGPALVDPATCTQSVGPAPDYVKTDCTPGPLTAGTSHVPCTPGTTTATAPNYTITTCTVATTTAQAPISTCTIGTATGASPTYFVTTCLNPAGATNAVTPVSSCTVGTVAATSPLWTKTVCALNTLTTTFVASCTDGTVSGSSPTWISTTCNHTSANNYTNQFKPLCTTTPGTTPTWISITCSTATLSSAVVSPASCTVVNPGVSPSYIYTACPSTIVIANSVDSSGLCAATGTTTGPGPGFVVKACTNGTNFAALAPIASCTVGTVAGNGGNSWTTTICTKPIDTSASPVPSAPCTTSTAPVTLIKTTCSAPVVTMVATPVDPTTCPLVPPSTTLAVSPFTVTHCTKSPLAALGGICSGNTNSGPPNWIERDCNMVVGGGPVLSCTLGTTTVGNLTTVCSNPPGVNNTTSNVPTATCTNVPAPVGPNFVYVTCGPVIDGPGNGQPVDPTTCVTGIGPGPTYYRTTCSALTAVAPYLTATAVASCPATSVGPGPSFIKTTCSQPALTNFSHNVSTCTPGTVAKTPPNYTTTTCTYNDSGPVAATGPAPTYCTNQVPVSPSWTTVTCTTVPGAFTNTPSASCATDPNTTCSPTGALGSMFVDTCPTPSPGAGPNFYIWNCTSSIPTTPVPDPTCMNGTGPGPNFVHKVCSTGAGTGYLRVRTTTTRVTTTPWSGSAPGAPTGAPPTVVTTPGATTQVDGVCYAAPLPFPSPNPQVVPTVSVVNPLAGGSLNSLADVSQYYYKTDLRPEFVDNVPAIGAGVEDDNTPHQHMTTFVVGLGVSGTLNYVANYRSVPGDYADIKAGIKVWPVWPDPTIDFVTADPDGVAPWTSGPNAYDNKKSIDDFWHTAVNGRGTYFSATNPTSVISGLSGALAGITAALASSTGEGVSSQQPVAGNNFIYTATYTTGKWTGDLVASTINLANGTLDTPALWSAQSLLDAKTKALCDNRNIYLARSGATNGMVNFSWNTDTCVAGSPSGLLDTQLNASEQTYFSSTYLSLLSQYPQMTDGTSGTVDQRSAAVGDKLVNYIRGQRGYEPFTSDQLNTLYRQRDHVLGDIVDSQPVYVKAPFAAYTDPGYDVFQAANAGRTPMIYVGANDGMLHAFYAGVDTSDPQKGQEAWAIIPSTVLPNLFKLADDNYSNIHQFYADGTPTIGDVYDTGTSSWRTILAMGLNNGGRAFLAVDVTDPAAPKTLWEFKWNPAVCPATLALAVGNTADCHLGFSFGAPIITKLPNGTWVVLVTSGYNNVNSPSVGGDGVGYLYVLNAMTGAIIAKISTGAGGATTPAGLAQINNYVDNVVVDNTTLHVYGGDLLGNIWRFDLGTTPTVTLIGTATDAATASPQPITVRPELAELNNVPMIFVGTGKLLGATDITMTQGQSIYGITDPLTTGTVYADLRGSMKPLVMTTIGSPPTATRTVACSLTATPAQCNSTAGWVVDLPEAGERVNVGMKLTLGTLIAASNVPQDTACSSGGHSWINYLNFSSGLAVSNSPGQVVSQYLANSLVVGLGVVALPPQPGFNNPTYVGEIQFGTGHGGQVNPPVTTPPPVGKRVSWREIAQ